MKTFVMIAAACTVAACVMAESKPFQASLTPDIAIYSSDTRINGVALNIWGKNPQSAFALGFINGSTGDSKGLSLGLGNYAENFSGVQFAFFNCASGEFVGWQGGFANHAEDLTGLQTGFFNIANKFSGLQLGVINYTKTAGSGVQLGLANIIESNGWFDGMPNELAKGFVFLNWRFE